MSFLYRNKICISIYYEADAILLGFKQTMMQFIWIGRGDVILYKIK